MAELSEQQGHLKSILSQQQELANEINQLNAKLNSNKTEGSVVIDWILPTPSVFRHIVLLPIRKE